MRDSGCDQEAAVTRAVASGQWGKQLQEHAESCANCGDVVRVSQLLQTLAAASKPHLLPAGYVWWQSQLRQRRAAHRRVTRLAAIIQTATVSVSITGLAIWIIWRWSEVSEGIKGSFSALSFGSFSGLTSNAPALVYISLSLLGLNLLLTVRAILAKRKSK